MNYTTYIANQNVRTSSFDTNPTVRTLISFDVGANWQVVRPPTTDDNECILVSVVIKWTADNYLIFVLSPISLVHLSLVPFSLSVC